MQTHEFLHSDILLFEDHNNEIPKQNMHPTRNCDYRKLSSILYEKVGETKKSFIIHSI